MDHPVMARPLSSQAPPVQPQRRPSAQPSNGPTNGDKCCICHWEADSENPLTSPCHGACSLRYVQSDLSSPVDPVLRLPVLRAVPVRLHHAHQDRALPQVEEAGDVFRGA
ncbi:hypothetical protein HPB48_008794 [Haemaphysalis longicornis]|uniref:Uncharacterized protein n=1 Tax=Haemaphysalis longicornis TaxID=44386 RepID=A0A9J6GPN8_HAELO|nr:hypothetical protein HPB48_008794 [Haemaphysalis longicornis]